MLFFASGLTIKTRQFFKISILRFADVFGLLRGEAQLSGLA